MTILEAITLILINGAAWLFFHFAISAMCFYIPLRFFLKDIPFLRIAKWEKQGNRWHQLFRVKTWKQHLMDGSKIVKKSYNKSHLHGNTAEQLTEFAAETKRAELTHWLLIVPAPLFFLWNPEWAAWINVAYAIIANVPFIVTQRYNRARIERLLQRVNEKVSR